MPPRFHFCFILMTPSIAILDLVEVQRDSVVFIVMEEWSSQLIPDSGPCCLKLFLASLRQCIEVRVSMFRPGEAGSFSDGSMQYFSIATTLPILIFPCGTYLQITTDITHTLIMNSVGDSMLYLLRLSMPIAGQKCLRNVNGGKQLTHIKLMYGPLLSLCCALARYLPFFHTTCVMAHIDTLPS